jgi:hypothetical protein
MPTYKVSGKWTKHSGGGYTDSEGNKWRNRRTVTVYDLDSGKQVDRYYDFKNKIADAPTPKPSEALPPDLQVGLYDTTTPQLTYYTDPLTGETFERGVVEQTSAQQALFNAYTDYLDKLTAYNDTARSDLANYFEIHQAKFGYDDFEKQSHITREYNLVAIPRLSFSEWQLKSRFGTLTEIGTFEPPTLREEAEALPEWKIGLNKFIEGAKIGWQVAASTGLPRIAAMGIAGMPDPLVGSMGISTAMYGGIERIFSQGENIQTQISHLGDLVSGANINTAESYKNMYLRLNEQAKRRGLIKNNWTLRMSRNIPIKERWRRLYVTLLDYIEKKQGRR